MLPHVGGYFGAEIEIGEQRDGIAHFAEDVIVVNAKALHPKAADKLTFLGFSSYKRLTLDLKYRDAKPEQISRQLQEKGYADTSYCYSLIYNYRQ